MILGAEDLRLWIQRRHLYERSAAQLIDGSVGRDPAQPKYQMRVRLDAVEVVAELHEDILRQILGQIAGTQHPQRKTVDGPLVRADERAERGRVPRARRCKLIVDASRRRLSQPDPPI